MADGTLTTLRERSRAKDATELAALVASMPQHSSEYLRTIVLPKLLPRLMKRAVKREAEAQAIADAFPDYRDGAIPHRRHRAMIDAAVAQATRLLEEAKHRERAAEMEEFLHDPAWYQTPKGYKALSPQGDTMLVFRNRHDKLKAMYRLAGREETWGRLTYPSFADAQDKVITVMRNALVKDGRLP